MRKHPDSRRISDLLEGELSGAEALELDEHLSACEECSSLLQDLRDIRARAQELPDRLPPRDLWPEIAQAIERQVETAVESPDVIRLHPEHRPFQKKKVRRIHLSLPQAAAAGLLLAFLSGLAGARIQGIPGRDSDTTGPIPPAQLESAWVSMVGETAPSLLSTAQEVVRLEEILAEHGGELNVATVDILRRNLDVIDRAIRESVEALRDDPGNRFLENNLERAVLAKSEYLRKATRLLRPET